LKRTTCEEIDGARPHLDRYTVGEQLPLAEQHAEAAEFERLAGRRRARRMPDDRRIIAAYRLPLLLLLGQW